MNQQIRFQEALARPYRAAMFDIDGTLMDTGSYGFSTEVVAALAALSQHVPLAICSGRRLEGFMEMVEPIFSAAADPNQSRKQWTFFLENGAMGLRFNELTEKYEKFYQVDWPHESLSMEAVLARLQSDLPPVFPKATFRKNECNIGVYIPNRNQYELKELARLTASLAVTMRQILSEFQRHETVRVIDSGVAVHILPVEGDKDRGIHEFARMLRNERGLLIGPEAREILIVGDQPCVGCNDEKFLEGKWGTPFTAEHQKPNSTWPLPILDAHGNIMTGPAATLSLIKRIQFT